MNKRNTNSFEITPNSTPEQLQSFGTEFCVWQRAVNWWIGDLARYAESRWPETWHQVFPEWVSPGLIDRCKAVAKAYAPEDRHPDATWSIHMREANQPDRVARVAAHVEQGRTSDEAREASASGGTSPANRWLLAFDIHYFLHRHYYSGAGVESAMQVAQWVERTVKRLREKGATDVVCACEGRGSKRRELVESAGWEEKYKDRPPKPSDLSHQIQLVRELLEGYGFCCASVDGWEADDVLASYAAQFDGKVTIITSDKDLRQSLSSDCNMLLDVEWHEDDHGGEVTPEYKWLSAKSHLEATEIRADQWTDYQALMGDNVDGIKGCAGVGAKGAAQLIQEFGSAEGAIQAAKGESDSITPKKRQALIDFESKLEVTRQLVTLKVDLEIPNNTRI